MTRTTREAFDKAVEYTRNNHDIEVREDYSGRGQFGRTVPAVVGEESAINEFLNVVGAFTVVENEWDDTTVTELLDAQTDVRDEFRIDSMGLDLVAYPYRLRD